MTICETKNLASRFRRAIEIALEENKVNDNFFPNIFRVNVVMMRVYYWLNIFGKATFQVA